MSLWNVFDIGASALTANRFWLENIADNLANANTTRTPDGGPYKRHEPIFQAMVDQHTGMGDGVEATGIWRDPVPGPKVYQPGNPDADAQGFVTMPNVNVVTEMVDMLAASRAYDANVTLISAAKIMGTKAQDIGSK